MKPTEHRKAVRAVRKKNAAKKKVNTKAKAKVKQNHEQRKKEKAKKRKEQREDFERKRRINQNNLTGKAKKQVLGEGDGVLPKSKKYTVGVEEKKRRENQLVNDIASTKSTT